MISLKDTGTLDFKYIFSYWVNSFSLKIIHVFIKSFQVVRLVSVLLNVSILLIVFLSVKNQLEVFFSRIWQHTVSVFKFISKKFLEILKMGSIYWLSVIPVLYILSYVTKVHSILNNDYWDAFFLPVFNSGSCWRFINALFYRNNEHLTFLPNVVFLINFIISRGNNKFLFLTNILINSLSLIFLTRFFSKERFYPKQYLWIVCLFVSVMFFSPSMSHNWIRSMSGVVWFLANLLFVLTLIYARKILEFPEDQKKYFKLISIFTIMAFMTYSTSLAVPVVIIFYLLLNIELRKELRKFFLQYSFLSILIYIFWFFVWYDKPSNHPDLTFRIFYNAEFFKVFIGSGFSENLRVVKIYGVVGLLLFSVSSLILLFTFIKNRKSKLLPVLGFFYSFILYAFINILLSSISRSDNRDIYNVLYINRYVNISNFFWMGVVLYYFSLILFIVKSYKEEIAQLYINVFLGIFSIFIFLPMYNFGRTGMDSTINIFVGIEEPFKLSMGMKVYDKEVFHAFINGVHVNYRDEYVDSNEDGGYYPTFRAIINTPLYKLHYPFNLKIPGYSYKKRVNKSEIFERSKNTGMVFGAIDNIDRLARNTADIEDIPPEKDKLKDYKITGWVCALEEKVRNMLILDDSDKMWGAGVVFEERLDINALYGEGCLVSGFVAYIREAVPGGKYSIFLVSENSGNYYFQDVFIPIN